MFEGVACSAIGHLGDRQGDTVTAARSISAGRPLYWRACSRRTRRRIFPDADLGIASTKVSVRTCL